MAKTFVLFLLVAFSLGVMCFAIPKINAWEANHNYPYGKLCDVFNNCSK